MREYIKEYFIIKQIENSEVIALYSAGTLYRSAIEKLSNLYKYTENVIKVTKDSFVYIENNKNIHVRIIPKLPQYVCGLYSNNEKVMNDLIKIRGGQ